MVNPTSNPTSNLTGGTSLPQKRPRSPGSPLSSDDSPLTKIFKISLSPQENLSTPPLFFPHTPELPPLFEEVQFSSFFPFTPLSLSLASDSENNSLPDDWETLQETDPIEPPPSSPPPTIDLQYLRSIFKDISALSASGAFSELIGQENSLRRLGHLLLSGHSAILYSRQGRGKQHILYRFAQEMHQGHLPSSLSSLQVFECDLEELIDTYPQSWEAEFSQRVNSALHLKESILLLIPSLDLIPKHADTGQASPALQALKACSQSGLKVAATYHHHHLPTPLLRQSSFKKIAVRYEDHEKLQEQLAKKVENSLKEKALSELKEEYAQAPFPILDRTLKVILDTTFQECSLDPLDSESCALDEIKKRSRDWIAYCTADLTLRQAYGVTPSNSSITPDLFYEVMGLWTGESADTIRSQNTGFHLENLQELSKRLKEKVSGQDHAIEAITKKIVIAYEKLKDPNRPLGVFLFLGPTGVGKTELSKALSQELFGSDRALIRINMAEYQEEHDYHRLIGAPPSYVGYEEGGELTNAIAEKDGYALILLDEIEKAHPKVIQLFLAPFDDGQLSDGKGNAVDMTKCLFIMTSNLKSEAITQWLIEGKSIESIKKRLEPALSRYPFRPEFYNRIDEVIPFKTITKDVVQTVVPLLLRRFAQEIERYANIQISWTKEVEEKLACEGYSERFGLRPLRRLVMNDLRYTLAIAKNQNQIKEGGRAEFHLHQGSIAVRSLTS